MTQHPTTADLDALLKHRASAGVLSVYVDADPAEQSGATPAFEIRLKNELRDLRNRDGVDAGRIDELLDAESHHRLLDPATSGRARAFFSSGDMSREFSFDLPLRTRVELAERPFVRPLVAALDRGAAFGIVTVSSDRIRVLDNRMGATTEISSEEFIDRETPRERRGPAAANPARGQQSATHIEQVEAHDAEWHRRFITSAVDGIVAHLADRQWRDIVLTASAELGPYAEETLSSACSVPVTSLDVNLTGQDDSAIAREARPVIDRIRAQRRRDLVDSAVAAAASPDGLGAVGVAEVSRELMAGRVETLVFDDSLNLAGFVADDGTIALSGEEGREDGREEPHVLEYLIEKAFSTSAEVIPLSGDEAGALSQHDGVAARLRW